MNRCDYRWAFMAAALAAVTGCAVGADDVPQDDAGQGDETGDTDTDIAVDPFLPLQPLTDAVPVEGERWRGFNIQGKYVLEWANEGYDEATFALMADFGFNFARLPLDYRTYTEVGDWRTFIGQELQAIDRAVEMGERYGVHISLNLHRAPGYCVHDVGSGIAEWAVIPENQQLDLWQDIGAQDAFIAHWRMFAERYRYIPNEHLSFDLVNEPTDVSAETYLGLMRRTVQVIREVSPDRIVVVEGIEVASEVTPEFATLGTAVSKHSYDPSGITHYNVPWDPSSAELPVPVWPPEIFLADRLYGHYKEPDGLWLPLVIRGAFPAGTRVSLHVNQVSTENTLEIGADNTVLLSKDFDPSGQDGEPWAEIIYMADWDIYQSLYDRDVGADLPAQASEVSFYMPFGDWITFTRIDIVLPDGTAYAFEPTISDFGVAPPTFTLTDEGALVPAVVPEGFESYYELNDGLDDWRVISQEGVRVVIGEFGIYRNTPHDVTLALMEFKLKAFMDAGFDWCLWDFIGDFGPFESNRADVVYEDYQGLKLDRAMLDLLQAY